MNFNATLIGQSITFIFMTLTIVYLDMAHSEHH